MRLEPELWDAIGEISRAEQVSLSEMIRIIEKSGHPGGRTSAVRVFIVQWYRARTKGMALPGSGHHLALSSAAAAGSW